MNVFRSSKFIKFVWGFLFLFLIKNFQKDFDSINVSDKFGLLKISFDVMNEMKDNFDVLVKEY